MILFCPKCHRSREVLPWLKERFKCIGCMAVFTLGESNTALLERMDRLEKVRAERKSAP